MQVFQNKIAVLITCFNRCEITLRCLTHLFELRKDIDVFLVDDNSTDSTYEKVGIDFPQVKIIRGNGNLFWNRGMRLAWEHAKINEYEFYFWLNDDVFLYKNAFDEILECSNLNNHKAIISGVIETNDTNRIIYGGYDKNKRLILPKGKMRHIEFLNGNFVLVPDYVFKKLGNLDAHFHHDLGDVDYGLRAKEQKLNVFSTRIPIGSGEVNNICRSRLNNSSIIERFKRLYSPLGSNPNIIFYFRMQHLGFVNAIGYYIFQLLLNILPDTCNDFLFKNRYK